jgi:hypothetical protein
MTSYLMLAYSSDTPLLYAESALRMPAEAIWGITAWSIGIETTTSTGFV